MHIWLLVSVGFTCTNSRVQFRAAFIFKVGPQLIRFTHHLGVVVCVVVAPSDPRATS